MEFEGIITLIGKEETIGEKQLKKITFVLEEESDREYKASIAIDLFGERAELISNYKVGQKVKAALNFRAREYNGRWYNSVSAWKLEGGSDAGTAQKQDDDLPF